MNGQQGSRRHGPQTEGVATGSSLSKPEFIDDPNAWGVAAFILGLVGSLLGLMVFTFPIAFVLGMVALVFGLVRLQKRARRAMTVWETGLGVLCIAISLLGAYVTLQGLASAVSCRSRGVARCTVERLMRLEGLVGAVRDETQRGPDPPIW